MEKTLKVALVQTSARPEIDDNLGLIDDAFMRAADQGAEFILTPENSCHMVYPQVKKLHTAPHESGHPFLEHFTKRVQERGVWLLLGSLTIKGDNNKLLNRSYLLSPKGQIVARYDKIHLFDVDTPDGVAYRESQTFDGGDKAALVHSDIGCIGMSICYDVRFPHLYRDMAQRGAEILTVPAAFTVPTGRAHWEVLLRARAIENGAFQTVRHRDWRWFDFLWMTHTMDYQGRDNFNTLVLRGFSLLGLITVLSGFLLWYTSSPTIRKIIKKKRK